MVRIPKRAYREAQLATHYSVLYANIMGRNYDIVPGEGDVMSKLVIVGEAPGETEERMGKPFVGKSGNLLMKWLKSVGLSRKDAFITNLIKHRPPGNADPTEKEAQAARVLMRWEIAIINPRVVVTLGRFATEVFYPNPSMRSLSGTCRVKDNRNHGGCQMLVVPVYHPSAALRSSATRARAYEDFKQVKVALETADVNPLL